MEYIDILDEVLLSDTVVDNFYDKYNNDAGFKDWLHNVLPEIDMCENQAQHNPWHKYNVLGHILHSVEEMNKMSVNYDASVRRMLSYIMLFHDIGKPACHISRLKDGEMIDSFFNHNIESEKVFRRVANIFNIQNVDIVAKLIYKHDIFMFIKDFPTSNPYWKRLSVDVIKEEIADLNSVGDGKILMEYLILVGMSDNLAQNEKMIGDSLRMLLKMQTMLVDID